MVEYGVPAGEASTVVARSQAVRGWGTAWPYVTRWRVLKLGAA